MDENEKLEATRRRKRIWAMNNPDKVRAASAKWRAANPEKARESARGSRINAKMRRSEIDSITTMMTIRAFLKEHKGGA